MATVYAPRALTTPGSGRNPARRTFTWVGGGQYAVMSYARAAAAGHIRSSVGELHVFCPEYWEREFADIAPASERSWP